MRLAARNAEARTREALERAIAQALDLITTRGARGSFAHGGYGPASGSILPPTALDDPHLLAYLLEYTERDL